MAVISKLGTHVRNLVCSEIHGESEMPVWLSPGTSLPVLLQLKRERKPGTLNLISLASVMKMATSPGLLRVLFN